MTKVIAILTLMLGFQSAWAVSTKNQLAELSITDNGFSPASLNVKPGIPVTLRVTRKTDATCATAINIPSKKVKKNLPLNKAVDIELGKLEKGELRFLCGMDMMSGTIIVN